VRIAPVLERRFRTGSKLDHFADRGNDLRSIGILGFMA
jgi:hypothetical protein